MAKSVKTYRSEKALEDALNASAESNKGLLAKGGFFTFLDGWTWGSAQPQFLLDLFPGAAFAYSKYKLKTGETISARGSNFALTEADIALGPTEWDTDAIETLAAGTLTTSAKIYNQDGAIADLVQATKTKQPEITDASGNALDYFDISAEGKGFFQIGAPATNQDYIVQLVLRDVTGGSSQRSVWSVKNSATDLFHFSIARSGSDYNIDYLKDVEASTGGDGRFAHTPANFTDWELYTITVIGGVTTLYINGNAKVWGAGVNFIDSRGANNRISLGIRPISNPNGRPFDFQTWIMHSGADLSGFDITGYSNALKALHGIS